MVMNKVNQPIEAPTGPMPPGSILSIRTGGRDDGSKVSVELVMHLDKILKGWMGVPHDGMLCSTRWYHRGT
jgi:hypothetical protein